MLVVVLLFVGHYWLQFATKGILSRLSGVDTRYWALLKRIVVSTLISYLCVLYAMGNDPHNHALEWGFWGRGSFIAITLYLTSFLSRFFQKG